jgi:hypothetical protein
MESDLQFQGRKAESRRWDQAPDESAELWLSEAEKGSVEREEVDAVLLVKRCSLLFPTATWRFAFLFSFRTLHLAYPRPCR